MPRAAPLRLKPWHSPCYNDGDERRYRRGIRLDAAQYLAKPSQEQALQKIYLALGAIGGGLALFMTSGSGSNKSTLEFSKPALAPATHLEMRPNLSSVFVSLPVDIGPLAKRIDAALPDQLLAVREFLPDAACGIRGSAGHDCNTAKLEGAISRNGPVELKVEPAGLRFVVPVKYTLAATGLGWASAMSERKSGETTSSVSFSVNISPSNGLDVTVQDESTPSGAAVQLLKANIKIARLLEPAVRPVFKTAEADLRRALSALPIKNAVHRVWGLLASPVELGEGSHMWLRSSPEYFSTGRFVGDQSQLSYQLAIATRLAVVEAKREAVTPGRQQPVSALDKPPAAAHVRLAMPIDLEAIRQAAEATFRKGQEFESRADRFSEPVRVKIRNTRIYPALRQIGLELDVEATTHKGKPFVGKLNLVGRPVIDAASGTVTLADVTFPLVSNKIDTSVGIHDAPRLGTEPFASLFAGAARLDIARPLADAMPRVAQLFSQRIGNDVTLAGRFSEAVPVSFELASDGAWLIVDVTGDITYAYTSIADGAAATPQPDISARGTSPSSANYKPAAAAATLAAGATAAALVAKRASSVKRVIASTKPAPLAKSRPLAKTPGQQAATGKSKG
jgi:Domain of unknown function (DUF4403)